MFHTLVSRTVATTALTALLCLGVAGVAAAATPSAARGGLHTDATTGVRMSIANATKQTLNLSSSSNPYGHWQQRPLDLSPGQREIVSDYSDNVEGAQITLDYTAAGSGATYTFTGTTPLIGDDSTAATSSDPSYLVQRVTGSGTDPGDIFTLEAGHIFAYSGHTETYTVPAGVTKLQVTAVGGASDANRNENQASGAQIGGIVNVTPGEVLVVGVGGQGRYYYDNVAGGWGMTNGTDNYSGGNGSPSITNIAGGGGGATVVLDGGGNPIVVAGGAGGQGWEVNGSGGRGGYHGSLIGQDGGPTAGAGGQAGANITAQGQSQTSGGTEPAGAGGGGVKGGMAGITGTGGGGGAGSSSDTGLINPTVEAAPAPGGVATPAELILTAAN